MIRLLAGWPLLAWLAILMASAPAWAGPERIAFPDGDLAGYLLYGVQNRPDNKQVRYLYANDVAVKGAKEGALLPPGSKLILEAFAAKLNDQGEPIEDPNGHYLKGDQLFYTIMEKQDGWGQAYPADLRNGDWDYAVILPDRSHKEGVEVEKCLVCHRDQVGPDLDYVFSLDRLVEAAAALQGIAPAAPATTSQVAAATSGDAATGGDAAKGEKLFRRCKACHIADGSGKHKIGPNLFGVVGRDIATAAGYKYSNALIALQGQVWDQANLEAWLTKPSSFAEGTKMSFPGFKKPEQRADVIAYLESLR